jgi:SAM-dependent methyltransferase
VHDDRSRAESFGAIAALYDRARPSYPPALIDALLEDAPRRILDVGCGTGIAAAQLAARGAAVLGVEVDGRMAVLARGRGVEVEVAAFERWDPAGREFDLVTCAQAWHWLEPAAAAARAAEVLVRGGRLGAFWNLGDPPAHVRARLAPIYGRLAPTLENYSVMLGSGERGVTAARDGIDGSGRFEPARLRRFGWDTSYTAAGWVELLLTHSDHQTMDPERRERLLAAVGEAIDEAGGSFAMRYEAVLVEARRL